MTGRSQRREWRALWSSSGRCHGERCRLGVVAYRRSGARPTAWSHPSNGAGRPGQFPASPAQLFQVAKFAAGLALHRHGGARALRISAHWDGSVRCRGSWPASRCIVSSAVGIRRQRRSGVRGTTALVTPRSWWSRQGRQSRVVHSSHSPGRCGCRSTARAPALKRPVTCAPCRPSGLPAGSRSPAVRYARRTYGPPPPTHPPPAARSRAAPATATSNTRHDLVLGEAGVAAESGPQCLEIGTVSSGCTAVEDWLAGPACDPHQGFPPSSAGLSLDPEQSGARMHASGT